MRIQAVMEALEKENLDAFWCNGATNRRYLSGFTGSSAVLLIHASGCKLFTDFRYTQQAMQQAQGFEVVECAAGEIYARLAEACMDASVRRLGFEEDDVPVSVYLQMRERFGEKIELVYAGRIPKTLRAIKTDEEIEKIKEAARITDEVFAHICGFIKEGMRERDIALEIDCQIKKRCGATSFATIAASGPNSALPHAQPGERCLKQGDALILDFGAVYMGYCSDFTRTLFVGTIDKELHNVYNVVRNAQALALEGIRAGMECSGADALARDVIVQAGYGARFGHSLGHGVGMDVHEDPRLSGTASGALLPDMVITVEPGIYIPELGGVRIEDLCVVRENGVENLVHATKEIIQV
ncbi:MAG: M24 family metallopeptidase [Bacillota bacterium]